MLKRDERDDPKSCWNKAKDDQIVFVLIETDADAPGTILEWIVKRVRRGKNKLSDPKIQEALACAIRMEENLLRQEHLDADDAKTDRIEERLKNA